MLSRQSSEWGKFDTVSNRVPVNGSAAEQHLGLQTRARPGFPDHSPNQIYSMKVPAPDFQIQVLLGKRR